MLASGAADVASVRPFDVDSRRMDSWELVGLLAVAG